MTSSDPESKFRSDALRTMQSFSEATSMRLQAQEVATAGTSCAIAQLGTKIDRLAESIGAQGENIGQLERAITQLVAGINAQRETMQQRLDQQEAFLKLATRQAEIIGDMAKGRAS